MNRVRNRTVYTLLFLIIRETCSSHNRKISRQVQSNSSNQHNTFSRIARSAMILLTVPLHGRSYPSLGSTTNVFRTLVLLTLPFQAGNCSSSSARQTKPLTTDITAQGFFRLRLHILVMTGFRKAMWGYGRGKG